MVFVEKWNWQRDGEIVSSQRLPANFIGHVKFTRRTNIASNSEYHLWLKLKVYLAILYSNDVNSIFFKLIQLQSLVPKSQKSTNDQSRMWFLVSETFFFSKVNSNEENENKSIFPLHTFIFTPDSGLWIIFLEIVWWVTHWIKLLAVGLPFKLLWAILYFYWKKNVSRKQKNGNAHSFANEWNFYRNLD